MQGRIKWDAAFFYEQFLEALELLFCADFLGSQLLKPAVAFCELAIAPGADLNRAPKLMQVAIGGVAGRAGPCKCRLVVWVLAEIPMLFQETIKVGKTKKIKDLLG